MFGGNKDGMDAKWWLVNPAIQSQRDMWPKFFFFCIAMCCATCAHAILAGGEFDLPVDSPSSRLDAEGIYSFTGALEISAGGTSYYGSGTALSPN